MQLVITFLYILFVLSAIVLIVVILLQEGKGGGLTDALGTSGQATFGVGASGINRFTGATAAVFLVSAVAIHMLNRQESSSSVVQQFGEAPLFPTDSAPPPDGSAPDGGSPPDGGVPPAPPAEQPK